MASIKLQDITKNFADKHVVKGVSIDVPDGEFLVLRRPFRLRQVDPAAACSPGLESDQRRRDPACNERRKSTITWAPTRASATSPSCSSPMRSIRT
jgi:hypothetical protein